MCKAFSEQLLALKMWYRGASALVAVGHAANDRLDLIHTVKSLHRGLFKKQLMRVYNGLVYSHLLVFNP